MDLWVVYDHPPDYPGLFVARRFNVRSNEQVRTGEILAAAAIEDLRELRPRGLAVVEPDDRDEPDVVEFWT